MTTEEMFMQLLESNKQINNRLDNIETRLDKIEGDVKEIKEDAHVTRVALNGLIDRTENFVRFYNELHTPAFKDF